MNRADFKEVMDYFAICFPTYYGKLTNGKSDDFQNKAFDAWFDVLQNCERLDAADAIGMLHKGVEPFPDKFTALDHLPATINKIASKLASHRRLNNVPHEDRLIPPNSQYLMADIHQFMLKCFEAEMDRKSVLEAVNKKFPVNEEDLPWYRCLRCSDSGLVYVWDYRTVQSVLWREEPIRVYRSVVRCPCEFGDKRWSKNMLAFSRDGFCEFGNGDVESLKKWMSERSKRQRELAGATEGF